MVIESEPGYVNNLIQAVLAFTEKMKLSCWLIFNFQACMTKLRRRCASCSPAFSAGKNKWSWKLDRIGINDYSQLCNHNRPNACGLPADLRHDGRYQHWRPPGSIQYVIPPIRAPVIYCCCDQHLFDKYFMFQAYLVLERWVMRCRQAGIINDDVVRKVRKDFRLAS